MLLTDILLNKMHTEYKKLQDADKNYTVFKEKEVKCIFFFQKGCHDNMPTRNAPLTTYL